jgi:hypothetical protein
MTKPRRSLMEVTGALSSCAQNAHFTFGEDTALVAVQHMLRQTVDLFRALIDIGLKPENIFALGKVYSNSRPVITSIRNMGATVIESTVPEPGEFDACFEHDVRQLWRIAAEKLAKRRVARIIVLDDGGKCITSTPSELLRRYAAVGVEQTSQGMFVFEEKPPPFAVFSWARSPVKLHIGGNIFSYCLIDKLRTQFLRGGKSLRGADVGIIGLGSIGRGLTSAAWEQGSRVTFFDADANLNIPQYLQDKVTRVDSLEELMTRCEYVFGSSGRNPFKDEWPLAYRPGINLFSASGGDQEFGPIIRDLRSGPRFKVAENTWDITSDDGSCGPIRIAYLGYAYNFVSRAPSAVPTRIVQLETGGLLAGLIQARSYLSLIEKGREQNKGIHRISPEAQRFVFQSWLRAMRDRHVDVGKVYGYDPAMLEATKQSSWFVDSPEGELGKRYEASRETEDVMKFIIDSGSRPSLEREAQANFCSL